MRELEIYIHIPFCVRKCAYCDFLSAPAEKAQQEAYVRALKREIQEFQGKEAYRVTTVFFGGGTPSILPGAEIAGLLALLRREFTFAPDTEISVECNPGTVTEDKLLTYQSVGVNRLSFGLQSADNTELRTLGRIHTWEDFLESYQAARAAGFKNINVDLMSALPGQTLQSWENTLNQVLRLGPEHISAYSLIIEEGTPFFEKYGKDAAIRDRGEPPVYLPSEEEERAMYRLTRDRLAQAGLWRYELSNYAVSGRECRHNIGYWRGTEYVGFGLGAASLLAEKAAAMPETGACGFSHMRRRNAQDMPAYLAGDFSGREEAVLTIRERMEEFMFLGLRMTEGVSEAEFARRFNRDIDEAYADVIRKQQEMGLLYRKAGRIALTERGCDVSNRVMAEFLL